MKIWKKKCPLFLLLVLSGCLFAGAGRAGANSIYADYAAEGSGAPGWISAVFQGWKDGVYPWMLLEQEVVQTGSFAEAAGVEEVGPADKTDMADTENDTQEVAGDQTAQSTDGTGDQAAQSSGPIYDKFGVLISNGDGEGWTMETEKSTMSDADEPLQIETVSGNSLAENDPDQTDDDFPSIEEVLEENKTYEFTAVGEEYFDDALFIGDSRTVGLASYAGFQEETDFYAATSLTIHNVFENPKKVAVLDDGRKVTIEEALKEKQYGKIYIMLGINELGRGTTETFFTSYAETVNQIRLLQPQAIIFVQGIMRVSTEKSRTDSLFKNETINARNDALALMANSHDIFYLEVNDAVCDAAGGLTADYTYDQVHLKAKYYQLWKDYLLAHGIVRE